MLFRSPYGELLLTTALLAAAAVLTCIVAWRLTGSLAVGVAAAFFTIVLKPQFYNYAKVLTPAVTLWLIQRYTDQTTPRRLVALGAWTVVAGLFRYDFGLYAAVGTLVALAARHWGNRPEMTSALSRYTGSALVAVAPYVVYLLLTGGVSAQLRDAVEIGRAHV